MPEPSPVAATEGWDPWRAWSSRWWALWQAPAASSAPSAGAFAPSSLVQPILPGWTFGNVIAVTDRNSASPDTEREIASEVSYGRQLGKVIDALAALVAERPAGAPANAAIDELLELRAKIERMKQASVERRVARLESDLLWLRERHPGQFERIATLLASGDAAGAAAEHDTNRRRGRA
jgi:hypothetical protein